MRKFLFIVLAFLSFLIFFGAVSGAVRSYGSNDLRVDAIASHRDETWFLTEGDGCAVFNKKTHIWKRKSGFESSFPGAAYFTDKWLFACDNKFDRKTGGKYPIPEYVNARDTNYIYLNRSRYVLKDDTIIPGNLDGEYHLIYSSHGGYAKPVNEIINGNILSVCGYLKDGEIDWYLADYERNESDSSKIKMDSDCTLLLIKIDHSKNTKEVIEGLPPTKFKKMFRYDDYIDFGLYKINVNTWERFDNTCSYESPFSSKYLIDYDSDGYWYYSNGEILNFDRNCKLKKKCSLSKNGEKTIGYEISGCYDDGEFIWIASTGKVYGINKATGDEYDYKLNPSPSEFLKGIGKGVVGAILAPLYIIYVLLGGRGIG